MASEWTPSTEDVRDIYALGNPFRDPEPLAEQFNRWLAAHNAEVRAPLEAEVERLRAEVEPAACAMKHQPPMDFAYCETHDTTFPLGDACKFQGRQAWEVYAEEADEQRRRAVMAEMAHEAAEAKVRAGMVLVALWSMDPRYAYLAERLRAALADPTPDGVCLECGAALDSPGCQPSPDREPGHIVARGVGTGAAPERQ